MVVGTTTETGDFGIFENGVLRTFNRAGKCINSNANFTPKAISNKRLYKAISILNSGTNTEVAVFQDSTKEVYKGNVDSAMKLMEMRGYYKRLQLRDEFDGIKYTQMIFIYDSTIDITAYVKGAVDL